MYAWRFAPCVSIQFNSTLLIQQEITCSDHCIKIFWTSVALLSYLKDRNISSFEQLGTSYESTNPGLWLDLGATSGTVV
jgi:hypothetical protein